MLIDALYECVCDWVNVKLYCKELWVVIKTRKVLYKSMCSGLDPQKMMGLVFFQVKGSISWYSSVCALGAGGLLDFTMGGNILFRSRSVVLGRQRCFVSLIRVFSSFLISFTMVAFPSLLASPCLSSNLIFLLAIFRGTAWNRLFLATKSQSLPQWKCDPGLLWWCHALCLTYILDSLSLALALALALALSLSRSLPWV